MVGFNWQKIAALSAILGGILQATLLFFQVNQLGNVLKGHYHVTWNWNVPREYRWISVSPWFFFLIALLFLHWYVTRQLRWPVWRGAIYILLTFTLIIAPEIALALVTNPNCVPDLPCNPGNRVIPIFLSNISIAGGMLLGGYLLFLSGYLLFFRRTLIYTPFSKFWGFIFLFLGVLAFQTCIVAAEVGEWIPGYFKIDLITMVLGFTWATTWCFIGCVLCLKRFSIEDGVQIEGA
ncbi:MAG: hypothetical protein ACYDER_08740 [Ktedonobacteraceae bacterium]